MSGPQVMTPIERAKKRTCSDVHAKKAAHFWTADFLAARPFADIQPMEASTMPPLVPRECASVSASVIVANAKQATIDRRFSYPIRSLPGSSV
jgi:hypothetical protein